MRNEGALSAARAIALTLAIVAPACRSAAWYQRESIVESRGGEILKEYSDGAFHVYVWRQTHYHYFKWVCHAEGGCFDRYSVDQNAHACSVKHVDGGGTELGVDCAVLKTDPDLAPFITW